MTGSRCPSLEELDRLVGGRGASEEVRRHAARCERCRVLVAELESHQEIAAAARRARHLSPSGEAAAAGAWAPAGYEAVRLIHRGGQATVHEVVQKSTGRAFALKVLRDDREGTPAASLRFQRELEILRTLDHPGIVPVVHGGQEDGRRFLVLSLVEGVPIDAWASAGRPLRRRLSVFAAVCSAVHHAHQRGVIHRDLKPGNILVDAEDRAHVLDFGVAGLAASNEDHDLGLTLTGEFAGTLPYAPPERLRGRTAPDVRGDVYSLGLLLYRLVTGKHPYEEQSSVADLVAAIERGCAPPPHCDADLAAIIETAMRRDPDERYRSADALREDVLRRLRGDAVAARGRSRLYSLSKALSRHRLEAGAMAFVVVVLAVAAVLAGRLAARAEKQRERAANAETEARRERDALQATLAEWRRLADAERAADLLERVDRLFPVDEALVPGCERWLAEAETLIASRDRHVAALESLRSRARRATAAEHRDAMPAEFRELDELLAEARDLEARLDEGTVSESRVDVHLERIDALQDRIEAGRPWIHDDAEDRWRDAVLRRLLHDIEAVSRESGAVRSRLATALHLRRTSLHEAADDWRRCVESLRVDPRFAGCEPAPRVGLVPLRRDPSSGLWEFWHVPSGDRPALDGDGDAWSISPETAIVLVLLPGGTFRMGSRPPGPGEEAGNANVDPDATALSQPVHEVTLAPFFMSKFEVTEGQWLRVKRRLPAAARGVPRPTSPGPPRPLPVCGMTHEQAADAARRLGMRLPTESQWEYACRAETTTIWFTGDEPTSLQGYANIFDAGSFPRGVPEVGAPTPGLDDGHVNVAPVGCYAPNPFGLHDMAGNLAEWCLDRMASSYRVPWRSGDGLRRGVNAGGFFAKRGGCYALPARRCASATRGSDTGETADRFSGFRPVLRLR